MTLILSNYLPPWPICSSLILGSPLTVAVILSNFIFAFNSFVHFSFCILFFYVFFINNISISTYIFPIFFFSINISSYILFFFYLVPLKSCSPSIYLSSAFLPLKNGLIQVWSTSVWFCLSFYTFTHPYYWDSTPLQLLLINRPHLQKFLHTLCLR